MPDIALVSLGTTPGLRRADAVLAELLREAGASCEVVDVRIGAAGKLRRHVAVTDLVEALAARRAARGVEARATIYSTVTAALLQRPSGPYAMRFDAPAALNRPGASGAWQRRREERALAGARVLLPWGEVAAGAARSALPAGPAPDGPAIVPLPVPVEQIAGAAERDVDAVTYAGWPWKRGLEVVCEAWPNAAPAGARLLVGGCDRDKGLAWLRRRGVPEPEGVEWLGPLPREEWLAIVARARVVVNASRREDHGLTQLEALAAGAALVTVPSPGAYEALPLARELAPELVAADGSTTALAGALRAGLAMTGAELAAYGVRAAALLAPYRRDAVLRTVRDRVLPALLGGAA
jgi:glycosyltransferase involved in cell wall biosynthesis